MREKELERESESKLKFERKNENRANLLIKPVFDYRARILSHISEHAHLRKIKPDERGMHQIE